MIKRSKRTLDKIQQPPIIKTPEKQELRKFLHWIERIYKKPRTNTPNGERLNALPLRLGTRVSSLSTAFHNPLKVLTSQMRQDYKEIKAHNCKEIKRFLFADSMMAYIENLGLYLKTNQQKPLLKHGINHARSQNTKSTYKN